MSSAATQFIQTAELVNLVLRYFPWLDIVRIGDMSPILRGHVQYAIYLYISQLLAPFIEQIQQASFWAVMDGCGAAITGKLPFHLLLCFPRIRPMALPLCEIIAPLGQLEGLKVYLLSLGYIRETKPPRKIISAMHQQKDSPLYLTKKKGKVNRVFLCSFQRPIIL